MDESQTNASLKPTKRNILREMRRLTEGVRPGDSLFFGFSGHGTQVADVSGDEADGFDECLVTVDGKTIVDDDLYNMLVRPLPKGALLTAITDCCHSGTILDLPAEICIGRRPTCKSNRRPHNGTVICFSGCKDTQKATGVDHGAGKAGGACTNAFLSALAENGPELTYGKLLSAMTRDFKKRGFDQVPVLSATHQLESREPFSLMAGGEAILPLPKRRDAKALNPYSDLIRTDKATSRTTGNKSRGWFDDLAGEVLGGGGGQHAVQPSQKAQEAQQQIQGEVRMFSGCKDSQTSADVSNVASFGLPSGSGPGGAGGACTNALMSVMHQTQDLTWIELLERMRQVLQTKGYSQIPQLSSSQPINLNDRFEIAPDHGGRRKALLVGINYVGQRGELRGCVNDVLTMRSFLQNQGFTDMRIMVDDSNVSQENATSDNILAGFDWLVSGAQAGDSLFFHYSGHGGQQRDTHGDEADGKDETIIPVDYQSAGQITDDVLFAKLVLPLPQGAQLTVLMDCCHSGSVMDLPYMFQASEQNTNQAINSGHAEMQPNNFFKPQMLLSLASQLFGGGGGGMPGKLMNAFFR
eukprot:NODE_357_length_2608_cov_73.154125_g337_i0.p1 GENE.NODE_357_length_2608_cov_73.154125_g337_i0~~NODE_357_length_2608_cov_73.154125_g337_i0.p1  ORF type:complete len:582 (-),score=155.72 NODE_357_length_2608_cov_73.154125_g337_i0:206-1951(-)